MPGPDGVLRIHLTRYPLEHPGEGWMQPESLLTHRMALEPRPRSETASFVPASWTDAERLRLDTDHLRQSNLASSSSVVVARADDDPPLLVLDRLLQQRFAGVIGVLVDDHTVLVWVHTHEGFWELTPDGYDGASGYIVTMTAEDPEAPGPVSLYPSALYGWALWWCLQAQQLIDDRDVGLADLPPPPLALDIVEAWRVYRVRLTAPDRVGFPAPDIRQGWPPDMGPIE
ncbi:hypothetical protein ACFYZH_31805 [Streptomyces abikoensis]|uniref:hypothetical protein n=1 Tax=Streptomyces abikoensis TaxID=97398 RepID=UPI0036C9A8CE